ncbi:substrate-binding domain-containing protein [uncultured Sphaerochaeta sp.]|uniref:substrate-binding domain-containing protein n=1 Tax=uncultured Sphaerochaeta sp. TaxID=886478 RepID=UPI002A0A6447|nr:substrate-binding domain-containing protein [uncultured Sphaerochaeta sp.]
MILTIQDIADLAGVSRGTVDRVIHKRGKVDPKVKKRINAIISEYNYKPSMTTQQISLRKQNIKIGFISKTDQFGFWSIVIRSMEDAERELEQYGITVEKRFFDYCFPETQLKIINEIMDLGISALVIAPLDDPSIASKLSQIRDSGIPIVLLNTEVKEFEPMCYIGSDYYVGGSTAAGLINSFSGGKKLNIMVFGGNQFMTSNTLRSQGFVDEMKKLSPGSTIYTVENLTTDVDYAYRLAYDQLVSHPETEAVLTIPNTGASVAKAIKDIGKVGRIIHVAYGMTDSTRPGIQDGSISAIVGHRAEQQGRIPFNILLDYFLSGKLPESKRILMLNDIFIKQNSIFSR